MVITFFSRWRLILRHIFSIHAYSFQQMSFLIRKQERSIPPPIIARHPNPGMPNTGGNGHKREKRIIRIPIIRNIKLFINTYQDFYVLLYVHILFICDTKESTSQCLQLFLGLLGSFTTIFPFASIPVRTIK